MRKPITLNEYIASLQKIAETNGNDELIAVGACCGNFNGMVSPFSLRLVVNGKQKSCYVPAYKEEKPEVGVLRKDGRLQIAGGTFHFWVKRHEECSEFGIDGGRISKLTITYEGTGREVVNYDRGWDIKPKTKAAQAALDWVLRNFN